jgi:hypothetical protein
MHKRKGRGKTVRNSDVDIFKKFNSPYSIQTFLNQLKYNPEYETKSPKLVAIKRTANCVEGALFAAAALKSLGYKPLIVDLIAVNDDDHVIAIFKQNNHYGAIAKSNTTTLRFREPVYRSLRELVMSYFDFYINTIGEKTLRSYSNPVNLSMFDKYNWVSTEEDLEFIVDYLFKIKHYKILDRKMINKLNVVDKQFMEICFVGSVKEGLFKPERIKVKKG